MIRQDQVIPLLLDACPKFHPAWQTHLDDWEGFEPEESDEDQIQGGNIRGYYNDINAFSWYLTERLRVGIYDEFPAAFAAIEQMMIDGDENVRQLLTIGLFEDLTHDGETVAQCLRWAGLYTHAGWFWVMGVRFKHDLFDEVMTREIELRATMNTSDNGE